MKPEILISIILLVYVTILALVTTYLSISVIRHVYYPVKPGEKHVGVLASAWNNIDAKYISGKYMDETSEGGVREGHVYDGIQELDNFMPPWLQVIMIGTVIFAAVYLLNIFVWGGIDYQKEEYEQEMEIGRAHV